MTPCQGHPTRRADLECEVACERKHPNELTFCPEFTPCLLECEKRFPKETSSQEDIFRCAGPCSTKYLKLDCGPPAPDHAPGGGDGSKGPGTASGGGAPSPILVPQGNSQIAGAKKPAPPESAAGSPAPTPAAAAAAPLPATAAPPPLPAQTTSAAVAPPFSPTASLGDATPVLPPRLADKEKELASGSRENTPLAELVRDSLADPGELTIFQIVTRKYREKTPLLQPGH